MVETLFEPAPVTQNKLISAGNILFKKLRDLKLEGPKEELDKLGPQESIIFNIIDSAGKKGITKEQTILKMVEKNLVTRQPIEKVLAYYQPILVKKGLIEVIKPEKVETTVVKVP